MNFPTKDGDYLLTPAPPRFGAGHDDDPIDRCVVRVRGGKAVEILSWEEWVKLVAPDRHPGEFM